MPYPKLKNREDLLKMLEEMIHTRKKILELCDQATTEQLLDSVYPGTWSVLKNLAHLAMAELYLLAHVKSRPVAPSKSDLPAEPPLDLNAIRIALDESHATVIAFLKAHPESVLEEPCVYGGSQTQESVGGIFYHIIEHEIGHRTFVLHKLKKLLGK